MKQLSCLLLLCFIAGAICEGTLYLNRITGNVDPITGYSPVYVECVTFTEDIIILDFINGLQGDGTGYGAGTYIEGSNNNQGSLTIPGNLHVAGNATVDGWVYANGGIFCDDMTDTDDDSTDIDGNPIDITYHNLYDDDDTEILKNDDDTLDDDVFDYSFTVDDNTGVTTVVGTIYPNGGITVGDNLFTVQDNTGRTEVNGLTRPDGGILVSFSSDDLWSVRTDGFLFSAGNISVEHDFYLGSDKSELRFFERVALSGSNTVTGGSTRFHGQDAGVLGGNLVFIPGFGTGEFNFHSNGAIYLGRVGRAGEFIVQRQAIDEDYANHLYDIDGGLTIIKGQDSSANGGDLRIAAGDATGDFTGGNIVLATGIGNTIPDSVTGDSYNGDIQLGPTGYGPYGDRLNFDLHITRPPITDASDAGDTIILGQLSQAVDTVAGDLIFIAGDGTSTNVLTKGGNLYLQPGEAHNSAILASEDQGVIYVGSFINSADLTITRTFADVPLTAANPGSLFLTGQTSIDGNGGDLIFVSGGGSAFVSNTPSILHLNTGYGGTVTAGGNILWDTQLPNADFPDDLYIKRDPIASTGTSTSILGQTTSGTPGIGGDLAITAGNGFTFGGAINLFGGKGHGSNGGSINVISGAAVGAKPGDISLIAGGSTSTTLTSGGHIIIWPGNGNPSSTGQNLIFSAGSNTNGRLFNGFVSVQASQFISYIPFVLSQATAPAIFPNRFQFGIGVANTGLKLSVISPNLGFFAYGVPASEVQWLRPRFNLSPVVHEPIYVPQAHGVQAANELNAMVTEIYNGLVYHNLFIQ